MDAHEFVCEHLFPGCSTKIRGESEEEVAQLAVAHMRSHHDVDPLEHSDLNTEMWAAIARLHG